MEELLKKLEETDFNTEEGCISILDELEKELGKVTDALDSLYTGSETEVNKVRTNLLSFLDCAAVAMSLIPNSLRRKISLLGRLQSFVGKILQSLKRYAQKIKVDSYSITMGVSPSITLTFKP